VLEIKTPLKYKCVEQDVQSVSI